MRLRYVPKSVFDRCLTLPDPVERAALFATLCRINALYMIQRAGSGHIGTSFSSADLIAWLYAVEIPRYRAAHGVEPVFLSSKGHDAPILYAALAGTGRIDFDLIHKLRRYDGLPGHPDVLTPGIVANTGSLGMGISKAKGIIRANRLRGRRVPVYVLLGDGELQEGQIWESLPGAVNEFLGELTVIVDQNRIQSDTWVGEVQPMPEIRKRAEAFGWRSSSVDGHNLRALADWQDLRNRDDASVPHWVMARTLKGRGVSFLEDQAGFREGRYRYHSGALPAGEYDRAYRELWTRATGRSVPPGPTAITPHPNVVTIEVPDPVPPAGGRLIPAYGAALHALMRDDETILALDADLLHDCGLGDIKRDYPGRLIECGIAEQDMVGQAGALARAGFLPVVHSFASFLTARAAEQIANNASERSHVVYVGSLAGVLPGGPGHSHQATRDVALMASAPGMVVIEPATPDEVAESLRWALYETKRPVYLRLTSIPVELPAFAETLTPLAGLLWRAGDGPLLIAVGPVPLRETLAAAERLAARGGECAVASVACPELATDWLRRDLRSRYRDLVVVIENHGYPGGHGDTFRRALTGLGYRGRFAHLAVDGIPACGADDEVLRHHKLDAASIAAAVLRATERRVA